MYLGNGLAATPSATRLSLGDHQPDPETPESEIATGLSAFDFGEWSRDVLREETQEEMVVVDHSLKQQCSPLSPGPYQIDVGTPVVKPQSIDWAATGL